MSVCAFSILWCVGAVVFWQAEKDEQGMTYFQAVYFSYVALLTIGYGDLAPKSNAGRAFFVVWSLVAVPTMTILISDMKRYRYRQLQAGHVQVRRLHGAASEGRVARLSRATPAFTPLVQRMAGRATP